MTREVLHTLERHAAEDEARDVGMPEDVRRDIEINGHDGVVVADLIAEPLDFFDRYRLAGDGVFPFALHCSRAAGLHSMPGVCV